MIYKIIIRLTIIGLGVYYVMYTNSKIETLQSELLIKDIAYKESLGTIETMQVQDEKQQKRISTLSTKLKDSETDVDNLRKKLQEHNLTALAAKKPGLIEKRINDATQKVFDDITSISEY